MLKISIKQVALILCLATLAACGGGSPEGSQSLAERLSGGSNNNSGGDGTAVGGETDDASDVVRIGSGTGENFVQGVLAADDVSLEAGSSTSIIVNLVDGAGAAIADEVTLEFVSDCLANGLASFTPATATTSAGRGTTVYSAAGCSGTDVVTARANVDGTTLQASVTLTIEADEVLAIRFLSSEPDELTLKGMGGNETSRVTFRLEGAQGAPIIGEDVRFSLGTTAGGIQFAQNTETAVSDNQGQVSTVVQSGTVATNLRVTAEHVGTGIRSNSQDLVISTGVPVDSKFSISVSDYAPAGALGTDGIEATVSVIASDQFGNDAFDGTRISFWTPESGNIDSSCVLESGQCSVTWISAGTRPADGRATIIAYTNGAEDFSDRNGNNVFDENDIFPIAFRDCNGDGIYNDDRDDLIEPLPVGGASNHCPTVAASSSYDLGEAYADQNENGQYDPGEYFIDVTDHPLGAVGVRDHRTDLAPQEWDGPCIDETIQNCSGRESVTIWENRVIIHSDPAPAQLFEYSVDSYVPLDDCVPPAREPLTYPPGSVLDISSGITMEDLFVSDATLQTYLPCHIIGNPMPSGTTMEFSTDNGKIVGNDSWEVPVNAQVATPIGPLTIIGDDDPSFGTLTLEITPPDASAAPVTVYTWVVED